MRARAASSSARSAGLTYALGAAVVRPARRALLAAAIILTRQPVLVFGVRAYVDIPYLVLVLGALLVETRRPRAGLPVLVLLGLAGLLRPEAWLFAAAYVGWLAARPRRARGPRRARRAAGVGRRRAGALGAHRPRRHRRPAALADRHARERRDARARHRARRRAADRARGGSGRSCASRCCSARRSAGCSRWPSCARARALPAVAGRARAGRVLRAGRRRAADPRPLPAAPGRRCWRSSAAPARSAGCGSRRDHPWRRRWLAAGVGRRCSRSSRSRPRRSSGSPPAPGDRASSAGSRTTCTRSPRRGAIAPACGPVAVPNHRPVPLLALWLDRPPREIVSAQLARPRSGLLRRPRLPARSSATSRSTPTTRGG